ncbi:MAG: nitroreductase family protein [Candidatus Omnitrophota bacterium]|nr:nitroreductase family protein [Candidatus Omnitrophota bacterium]
MHSFLELVNKRSSVRRYSARPIPREVIGRCLEAARLAPSACNSQPWYFIIVDDPSLKDKISAAAFSGIYSMNSFAKNAPALAVVVREKSSRLAAAGGCFRGVQYNLIDIGIACEHFILQAAEDGVGTCWLGWFNERAVKKALGIPREKKADMIISMGYPEKISERPKTRKSLDEISTFNNPHKS